MPGNKRFRYTRVTEQRDESQSNGPVPVTSTLGYDLDVGGEEDASYDDEECGVRLLKTSPCNLDRSREVQKAVQDTAQSKYSRWRRQDRTKLLAYWLTCGKWRKHAPREKSDCTTCKQRRRPLRVVLKGLAVALMLLGLIEFVILAIGLVASFFPSELDGARLFRGLRRPSSPSSHWPTDQTADIQPVQCHSHNDYWRSIPLKSAISAGCTGVEADVWLFSDQASDELYVGHSKASLTPERTFRSLYIDPLVEMLEQQNPNTTFHPMPDNPRNGIFDTVPGQTLVLLVDFKTDGLELWPVVRQQLEPLRQRRFLTYFNGTSVINGPITVVATGNAPFNKVVESPRYRDIFFDAPLELLGSLGPRENPNAGKERSTQFDDVEERTYLATYASELATTDKEGANQGQGHSGAAPKNAAIYTPANSYYASVSFTKSVGLVMPFLTRDQKHRIRQQVAGAHKQGLKVRYWDTPSWPRGLREYIWRVLVEEGIDYLNVDDLIGATRGDWGGPRRPRRWRDWSLWSRG